MDNFVVKIVRKTRFLNNTAVRYSIVGWREKLMLHHEEILKQFSWGLSILTAYLHYNSKINYTDINILSEGFVRDLLNILYELELNNSKKPNEPGYDLISKEKKVIVQVSTTCTPQKVNHTFNSLAYTIARIEELEIRLEKQNKRKQNSDEEEIEIKRLKQNLSNFVDIRGYRVIFFFLCENADPVINYGQKDNAEFKIPSELQFCQKQNVLCFSSLIRVVNDLSEDSESAKIDRLKRFMIRNANLFIRRDDILPTCDKVSQIINEYSKNFVEPLFLHRYKPNTRVILKNLFVDPSFIDVHNDNGSCYQGNIITLLDSFVWDSHKDRLLFIDGDAAIGKTSLISWLCYHYLELDDVGKSIFCNIQLVCVRLRDLAIEENESAENCLLRYLSFKKIEEFEELYGNALIVLEGADELGLIGGIGALTIEQFILNVRHAFSNHKIVITSRPKFINMSVFSGLTQTFTYQHYSLKHFSKDKRDSWIKNYEQKDKCGEIIPKNTKQYLSNMTDDEASGVADTPLALYLLADCDITARLSDNKWALYREIFHNAIRNTPYNESFHSGGNTQYHHALKEDEFAEIIYITIGKIANRMFKNTKEDRFYITSTELDDIIFSLKIQDKSEKIKAIRKCCVLCAYWKENTNTGALEFYHNNIRDFFMCEYIYQRFFVTTYPINTEETIYQLIETACEVFQYGMIAQTTWAQTFSFLYFRLQDEKHSKNFEENAARKLNIEKLFPTIIYTMTNNIALWKYSFNGPQYESAKTTFLNFALFLRVWIATERTELLETFSSENNYNFWHGKGVFEDWKRIFIDTVDISQKKHIAFGSDTKFLNMDFKQSNLEAACFENSEFRDSSFENATLGYANYSGAILENVNFSGADLHNVDFSNTTLINVDFSKANLQNARFMSASIKDVTWPSEIYDLYGANFSYAHICNATWKHWEITATNFTATEFENCSFHRIQFFSSASDGTFNKCSITNTSFENVRNLKFCNQESNITDISFNGIIEECLFKDLTIDGSNWAEATIDKINFVNVHMKNTNFISTTVMNVTFSHCRFDSINVYKAKLSKSVADYINTHAKKVLSFKSALVYAEDASVKNMQ